MKNVIKNLVNGMVFAMVLCADSSAIALGETNRVYSFGSENQFSDALVSLLPVESKFTSAGGKTTTVQSVGLLFQNGLYELKCTTIDHGGALAVEQQVWSECFLGPWFKEGLPFETWDVGNLFEKLQLVHRTGSLIDAERGARSCSPWVL